MLSGVDEILQKAKSTFAQKTEIVGLFERFDGDDIEKD